MSIVSLPYPTTSNPFNIDVLRSVWLPSIQGVSVGLPNVDNFVADLSSEELTAFIDGEPAILGKYYQRAADQLSAQLGQVGITEPLTLNVLSNDEPFITVNASSPSSSAGRDSTESQETITNLQRVAKRFWDRSKEDKNQHIDVLVYTLSDCERNEGADRTFAVLSGDLETAPWVCHDATELREELLRRQDPPVSVLMVEPLANTSDETLQGRVSWSRFADNKKRCQWNTHASESFKLDWQHLEDLPPDVVPSMTRDFVSQFKSNKHPLSEGLTNHLTTSMHRQLSSILDQARIHWKQTAQSRPMSGTECGAQSQIVDATA